MIKNKTLPIIAIILTILVLAVIAFYVYVQYFQKHYVEIYSEENNDRVEFLILKPDQLSAERFAKFELALSTLQDKPYDRTSLLNLGQHYLEAEEYKEAEKAYEQHLKVDPYEPDVLLGLGRTRVKMKEYKKAEENFYQITEVFPLYMQAYKELLKLYQQEDLKPNEKFVDELRAALEIAEQDIYKQEIEELIQAYRLATVNK